MSAAVKAYKGPTAPDLTPDTDATWRFVSWWFQHCRRGLLEIGWMDPAGSGLTNFRRFELEDEALWQVAARVNSVPGQSVYIRAATIRAEANARGASDADFVQAPGIWGDLDTREDVERAAKVEAMVRPNGWTITGMTPHMRAQLFFRADEPLENPEQVRNLNRRLRGLYGGDPAVVNPTRLMRLPGTIAWPWKDGRVPEVTRFDLPADSRPSVYPVHVLTAQLPQEAAPAPESGSAAAPRIGGLDSVSEAIRGARDGHEWHNNVLRLTARWVGRGWSNQEILLAAEGLTLPGFTVQQTRIDLLKMVDGARGKWGVPDEDPAMGPAEPATPFSSNVIDPWDTLQPPEFPIHALPPRLHGFVEARSRVMGSDPCALAWTAISACSAALDGRMRLQMKRHDNWAVPPAIWVALVGASSTKKSPVINAAWGPLERRQNEVIRNWSLQMANYKSMSKKEREETEPPPPPLRFISHDATMEGLQEILGNQDRGIGVLRDELAGFIGSLEKYSGGGKGGAADRAFYLQAYNGGPYVVDRVGRGMTAVNNLLVTLCGGIQPDRLAQFSNLSDDGLWQRFVPIIVRPAQMGTDEPAGAEVEDYQSLVQSLLEVRADTRASFADGAHEIRRQLEREIFDLEQSEPFGPRFGSFLGKLPGLFGRLCLVLSHIAGGPFPYIVSEEVATSARTLINFCVIPHAAQVYLTMGGAGGDLEATQSIAGFILSKGKDRVLASALARDVRCCRHQTLPQVQQLVSPLVAGGWLSPEQPHNGNSAWTVNPTVHQMFADRARRETARRAAVRQIITGEDGDEGDA